jgi:UDP-GlcNAc:undecaprenyl-phosphate/decaprenyl-phosphate GlcNAc-1-phosphate transferase
MPVLSALVLPALAAALLSVALCGLVRRVALRGRAVLLPRADRWHSVPTPTMGGVGFVLAAVLVLLAALALGGARPVGPREIAVPLAALAMFAIGALDDRLQLVPLAKLVSSLIVGALVVFAIGAAGPGGLPWPATLVAVVWFGGIVHALNLLDNMDALAGGIALCAAALMAWLFAPVLGPFLVLYLVIVVGSVAGFLYWNRPPAKLFMGDSGSLFLGGSLAAASLVPLASPGAGFWQAAVGVGLVLVVPLLDTSFVLVLRRLAGRKATRGGTDHVSHRLVSLGLSERSAVRALYLLALAGGGVAVMVHREGLQVMLPLVAMFGVAVALGGVYLARVPAYESEDFRALQKSSFAPFLNDLAFRFHAGQVLLDLVLITACYYAAYRIRFEGEAFANFFPYFAASLPVVLGCKLAALYASGLYGRSWDTFSFVDLWALVRGVAAGSVLSVLVAAYVYRLQGFSRAVFIIDAVLLLLAVAATRASFRAIGDVVQGRSRQSRRVLVYGAGAGGQLLVREMRANPEWNLRPVGFVDDDPITAGRVVLGVPVLGAFDDLARLIGSERVAEVILSSAAIGPERESAARAVCGGVGVPVRRLHLEIR